MDIDLQVQFQRKGTSNEVITGSIVFYLGQVWVCYGEQNYGKVCYINCEDSVVFDLGIEVNTTILTEIFSNTINPIYQLKEKIVN